MNMDCNLFKENAMETENETKCYICGRTEGQYIEYIYGNIRRVFEEKVKVVEKQIEYADKQNSIADEKKKAIINSLQQLPEYLKQMKVSSIIAEKEVLSDEYPILSDILPKIKKVNKDQSLNDAVMKYSPYNTIMPRGPIRREGYSDELEVLQAQLQNIEELKEIKVEGIFTKRTLSVFGSIADNRAQRIHPSIDTLNEIRSMTGKGFSAAFDLLEITRKVMRKDQKVNPIHRTRDLEKTSNHLIGLLEAEIGETIDVEVAQKLVEMFWNNGGKVLSRLTMIEQLYLVPKIEVEFCPVCAFAIDDHTVIPPY